MNYYNKSPTITKREVLFSIVIIAILLILGFIITDNISDNIMLKYQEYNTALTIDNNTDQFIYAMKTDAGNTFIYGYVEPVDTVSYSELEDEFLYIKKVKEKYTQHTRTYTTTVDGKTQTHVETYYSWDKVSSESQMCNEILFCGVTFNSSQISVLSIGYNYSTIIKESSKIRYKYYGILATMYEATIYSTLSNNTISDNTNVYYGYTIEETIKYLESNFTIIIFWVFWVVLIIVLICGFYYLDNKWLEDKKG